MTILHVLTSIDPKHGGTVTAVRQMVSVADGDSSAEVLSLETPQPEWLKGWPVKVHWIGHTRSYYRYTAGLVPWMEQNFNRYDAVIIHGVWRYPSVGVWRVLRKTGTPYFLFTHGMLDPWFQRAYPGKHIKKAVFWRLLEHRVLRDAQAVLFTSEDERRLAKVSFRPYVCREQVVGLGISSPPDMPGAQRDAFLRRFPHLRGKRIILFLSRIHRVKGCDLLVRAFAAIAAVDPRLHLVIGGPDGEGLRPDLERLALACGVARQITWTGNLDGDSKWGAFRAAEVFALLSHTESFGISVAEALACKVPVLITNKVNIWREIAEDKAGLVANDDIEGVTDLLENWASFNEEQRQVLGVNARTCFSKRFELGNFTKRFKAHLTCDVAAAGAMRAGGADSHNGTPKIGRHSQI
jgi:glycosyltransferase involved in cell wall biosynthesis